MHRVVDGLLLRGWPLAVALAGLVLARTPLPAWARLAGALLILAVSGLALAARLWPAMPGPERLALGVALLGALLGGAGLAAYALAPPVDTALGLLGAIAAAPLAAWALVPPAGARPSRPAAVTLLVGGLAILAGLLVLAPGAHFPAGWDGPFHAAALHRLLESPAWVPPEPYFVPSGTPVPQYGLDPWYPVLALLAAIADRDPLTVARQVPVALAPLAVVALFALTRGALSRPLAGSPALASAGGLLALALAFGQAGAREAAIDWRTLLLPEQAALLLLVPAALLALWAAADPGVGARRVATLLAAALLAAMTAATHLVAGALVGAAAGGELLVVVIAGALGRRTAVAGGTAAPIAVLAGLGAALALVLPPLVAMTRVAGPLHLGNPDYLREALRLGPFVVLDPRSLLGVTLATLALIAAPAALVLGRGSPGVRGLAAGALGAWAVLVVPPLPSVVVELAGFLYLRRLAAVPAGLAVPLAATLIVLAVHAVAERRAGGGTARPPLPNLAPALSRLARPLAGASLLALAGAVLAAATVLPASRGRAAARPPWVPEDAWARLAPADDGPLIRRTADALRPYLPRGSVVLADPATSYLLPAVLDVRVVAVPAVHSLSADPDHVSVDGRTAAGEAADRVLAMEPTPLEQRAILERYGVTRIVLVPGLLDAGEEAFTRRYRTTLRLVAADVGSLRAAIYRVRPGGPPVSTRSRLAPLGSILALALLVAACSSVPT